MSHPTDDPSKKKGGFTGFVDKLRRFRARSSASSQIRPGTDRTASPSISGLDGASETASVAGSVNLRVDTPSAGQVTANPSGSSSAGERVRAIKLPHKTEPAPSATEQPFDHEDRSSPVGVPEHDVPEDAVPDPEIERQDTLWAGLQTSLGMLKDVSGPLPGFVACIETLLSYLDHLKIMSRNQPKYEDVTKELTALGESLGQEKEGLPSVSISDALLGIIALIAEGAHDIKAKLDRGASESIAQTSIVEEVLPHYQRIEALFRKLQDYTSASARNVPDESLKARLDRLKPVEQATYNSSDATGRRGCTEGTRETVLDGLDKWLKDPASPSVYWIDGMPGTGKTAIAYTFCEQMEERKLLGASFFCAPESEGCDDANRILPTIAYQLAKYSIPFQSALSKALVHNTDVASKTLPKQFEHLLVETVQQVKDTLPDRLVVVIDALDEFTNRSLIELILDQLFQHAPKIPLKFLVTSRPETEIYLKMSSHSQSQRTFQLQDITKSQVQADIKLYLTQELEFMSPTETEINQLVERSGVMFKYAASLVEYAQSTEGLADPSGRLRSLINMTPDKQRSLVDPVYLKVMDTAFGDDEMEEDETAAIRVVLNTVLLAQEPISIETIGMLGGIDDLKDVENALHPLRSALHHSEKTGLVSPLDSAFPEIMFSKERSGSYFCDAAEHSQLLAQGCLLGMKEQLRFNICGLDSSGFLDKKVENLQSRIKNKISSPLAYACRYWADHLSVAAKLDGLLELLTEFLATQLLYWLEVLNLRRELDMGIAALLKAKRRLEETFAHPELVTFLDDAYVFTRDFAASPVSRSTPHIYISALQLCSRSSMVYRIYSNSVKKLLKPHGGVAANHETTALDHQSWKVGSGILSIAYSPDGTQVAVGCEDKTISIYDLKEGSLNLKVGPLLGHDKWVRCVVFSPDGKRVVSSSSDSAIRMWDVDNGDMIEAPFLGHTHPVKSLAFSTDGSRIISGSWDNTICIWDAADGSLKTQSPELHKWGVNCVAFQPHGKIIASGGNDHMIRLWELTDDTLSSGEELTGHSNAITSIAFTPNGGQLVSSSVDSTTCIWNMSDNTLVDRFLQGCSQLAYSVAVSPNGSYVASGSADSTVKVWNIETGKIIAGPFAGHSGCIRAVSFSPNGFQLLSGSHDGTLRAWDLRTGSKSSTTGRSFRKPAIRGSVTRGSSNRLHNRPGVPTRKDVEHHTQQFKTFHQEKQACLPFHSHTPAKMAFFAWLLDGSDVAFLRDDPTTPREQVPSPDSDHDLTSMPNGYKWGDDGWIMNGGSELLAWVDRSFGSCDLSDHNHRNIQLIISSSQNEQFVGNRWPGSNK